ncbi:MAG: hypothetical protein QOG20_4939, partial [Pseudonocardiales bacterium]|nr:hypothetical protein [Pseudonocardiales bacterium]
CDVTVTVRRLRDTPGELERLAARAEEFARPDLDDALRALAARAPRG